MSGSAYVNNSVQGYTPIVNSMAAAVQSATTTPLDLNPGSVMLAEIEAFGGIALWLQGLVLQVMTMMRLTSSVGPDVDSFVAQFGLTRLGGVAASTTSETFGRYTTTLAATIPVGATIATADGTQIFSVIADTRQSAYSSSAAAYLLAAGTASCTVTVQAQTIGVAGNVPAATITQLTSVIPGVDYVTNSSAATGGTAGETDNALAARFALYIQSLAKSTPAAIQYAVTSIAAGASCYIIENSDFSGSYLPGFFQVIVDDGSGAPQSAFLSACYAAVATTRAITTAAQIVGVSILTVAISVTASVSTGYSAATAQAAISAAIVAYMKTLTFYQTLAFAEISGVVTSVAGVSNVFGLTLAGGTVDITPAVYQKIRAGTVSVTTYNA